MLTPAQQRGVVAVSCQYAGATEGRSCSAQWLLVTGAVEKNHIGRAGREVLWGKFYLFSFFFKFISTLEFFINKSNGHYF